MRLLLQIIDWEYPKERSDIRPELYDVSDRAALMTLYLSVANGVIIEMRAVAETEEGLAFLRGLLTGAGSCRPVTLTESQEKALWLYRPGDECYLQGKDGFFFINPQPQPDSFAG